MQQKPPRRKRKVKAYRHFADKKSKLKNQLARHLYRHHGGALAMDRTMQVFFKHHIEVFDKLGLLDEES